MRKLKLVLICLTAIGLNSCNDKLPISHIHVRDDVSCTKIEIVKIDPLTFGNGEIVDPSECKVIYGVKESEVGGLMDWFRRQQENLKATTSVD